MRFNKKIKIALLLILMVIMSGIAGYMLLEGYTVSEAFFMTMITVTTVGFGEVRPLSESGRLFTTGLILVGFASLTFVVHTVVELVLERVMSGKSEIKKMEKQISALSNHFIICGFGRVGAAAAEQFGKAGVDFVVIESTQANSTLLKEKEYHFLQGDATHEEVLLQAGLKRARGVLAILPSDPDNLFIALTAREFNPLLHIITRAEEPTSEKKLLRAGADSVISPFATAGRQIAEKMLAATGQVNEDEVKADSLHYRPSWVEVKEGSGMAGEKVGVLAQQMGREVMGLRRNGRDFIMPGSTMIVQAGDSLLILQESQEEGSRLPALKPEKQTVLIADDNPVILNLYTRLLQRAGFVPITAENGVEAYHQIISEKPDGAVIDYHLPGMSGIEVCRKVRREVGNRDIKLLLFTSDNGADTRRLALAAGVDVFLHKSANASELIENLFSLLHTGNDKSRPNEPLHLINEKTPAEHGAVPPETNSPLNLDALLEHVEHDHEILKEITAMFLEETPGTLQHLAALPETENWEELSVEAHKLKGVAANLEARELEHETIKLERAVTENNKSKADASLKNLIVCYGRFKKEIEKLVLEEKE